MNNRDSSRVNVDLRVAAIDVGSNSIHMIIAQVDPDGGVTTLWRLKEMVGLGRITFPARRLSAEAMDRALGTLRRFQQETRRRGVEKTIAVATSAVREADNGGDFVERVRLELGLPLRVVSAREEAQLIYLGVRHATGMATPARRRAKAAAPRNPSAGKPGRSGPRTLIVDIGGGSVEFIVADSTGPLLLESRKLGSARITAKYIGSDPIAKGELHGLRRHYDRELAPLCRQILALKPTRAIGTSGTLENLAAMTGGIRGDLDDGPGSERNIKRRGKRALPPGIAGYIDRQPLQRLTEKLIRSRAKDRMKIPGLDEKRQDQIVAGTVLAQELFERLSLSRMALCRAAMREGVLVEYISRHLPDLAIRRDVPDPRRRSVYDLGRRCDWRQKHSEHVSELALQLFDGLRPLHHLGKSDRELIEYGALLHDIGWHIGPDSHHKHSLYLILNGNLKGFTPEEVRIIANVARYHRKSPPKPEHEAYQVISPHGKKVVRVGAALLRICDGLDRSHGGVARWVSVRLHNRSSRGDARVQITVHSRGDAELELWAARQKTGFFAQVFGREISFEESKSRR